MNNFYIYILHVSKFSSIEHIFLHRMERKKFKMPNRTRKLQLHLFLFCMYSLPQSKCLPQLFLLSASPSLPAFSSFHGLHFRWEGSWAVVLIPVASSKQLHREISEQNALLTVGSRILEVDDGVRLAGSRTPAMCRAITVPAGWGFTVNERGEGWVAVHWQTMQN